MKRSSINAWIAGAAICLSVTPAMAFRGQSAEDRAEFEAIRAEVFTEADADGDGALSATEFEAFHELLRARMEALRFAKLDADSSGGITLEELEAAPHGRRHGPR